MSKILIVAEKPSVATDLARVLAKAPEFDKFTRHKSGNYFENDQAVITSAIGHLVELEMPTGPNGKKLPWNFNVLPVIPKSFTLEAKEKTEDRLKLIIRLAKRKDIGTIVNACDAGREGELIFRYIMDYGKIDKPMKRLWMRSMTQGAILDAWSEIKDEEAFKDLSDAAYCRSESDWLLGLNGTRAMTVFESRNGGFNITPSGRVQTPTLAILADREQRIREFKAETYYEIHADFAVSAGVYPSKWIDETFKKSPDQEHGRAERIWEESSADQILDRCQGKSGIVSEERKPSKQAAPQLYDLTTLQREASGRFGFSAKRTLQLAQACYEKFKVLTYPRTDSKYLPEDYIGATYEAVEAIKDNVPGLAPYAEQILKEKRIKPNKRIFNDAKVSDHFAIIPTGRVVAMDDDARKIFELVTKRFLAVFFPSAVYEVTKRFTRIDHGSVIDTFRTDGRILVEAGWRAIYGQKPGIAAGKDELCAVQEGETAKVDTITKLTEETRPPARFNDATLLSAMEGAGKLVEDDELREAMSERGLGTPATRAATIEGLLRQKYLARDGRDYYVTSRGMRLIETLREFGIEELTSPEMTGEWEYKLKQMEQGRFERERFMNEIKQLTERVVEQVKGYTEELKNRDFPELEAPCPVCGAPSLRQTDGTFECREEGCKFKISKYIASRPLSMEEAKQLVTTKFLGPLTGFKSRFNKPFDAALALDEKFKVKFVFDDGDGDEAFDELTEDQIIGNAPGTKGDEVPVYETDKAYLIPGITTKNDPKGIRIGKVILQKELPPEEILQLLRTHKTNLLKGFVSRKNKRKFDAFLLFDPKTGKIGFDFPPRPAKKGAAKKTAAKKTAKKKA